MRPYLFDWVVNGHHLRPPTYGVLLAIAFSLAYFECLRRAVKLGEPPRHVENQFLLVVLASVLGARMFHVLFEEPTYYFSNPSKIFALWEGGYTLYGALLLAILFIFLYGKRNKLNFLQYTDIAGPSTMLGIAIGRTGCFFAGCCWGTPTNVPWAVTFTNPQSFTSVFNVPLHPAQLYEAFGAFLIFLYLMYLFRHRKYKGQITFHGLIAYSLLRFTVEYFRGDLYRGYIIQDVLSYSQFVSLLIVPLALGGIVVYRKADSAQT